MVPVMALVAMMAVVHLHRDAFGRHRKRFQRDWRKRRRVRACDDSPK